LLFCVIALSALPVSLLTKQLNTVYQVERAKGGTQGTKKI